MSGRGQTGHNQMVKRRRMKKLGKKLMANAAKRAKKLRNKAPK